MTDLHQISQFAGVVRQRPAPWRVTTFQQSPADARRRQLVSFLDELTELARRGAHRQTAGRIHDLVTASLRDGDIDLIDALLRMSNADLGAHALTSLLIVTRPVADKLAARKAVRALAEKALVAEVGPAEAEETLRQL